MLLSTHACVEAAPILMVCAEVPAKFGVSETKAPCSSCLNLLQHLAPNLDKDCSAASKATQDAFQQAGMKVMRILEEIPRLLSRRL